MAALAFLAVLGLLVWLADEKKPRRLQIGAGALLVVVCVFLPTLLGAPA